MTNQKTDQQTKRKTSVIPKSVEFLREEIGKSINRALFLLLIILVTLKLFEADVSKFLTEVGLSAVDRVFNGLWPEVTGPLLVSLFISYFVGGYYKRNKEIEREKSIDEINRFLEDLADRNSLEIQGLQNGLKEIKVTDVFKKAKQCVEHCNAIYVVGTAKQDYKDPIANKDIEEYLSAIIRRVKDESALEYQRITTLDIKPKFHKHLVEFLAANWNEQTQSNNHDECELLILDDFTPAYTYLIIDKKFFMLSLNFSNEGTNSHHYYSENENVVRHFTSHFKSVWDIEIQRNKPLKRVSEFESHINYRKDLEKKFNVIRHAVNGFQGTPTHVESHALSELDNVVQLFQRVKEKGILIFHENRGESLLATFCDCLSRLKKDDTYETVTFYDFWKGVLQSNSILDFMERNRIALEDEVSIVRILVISPQRLDRDKKTYGSMMKKIVSQHIELLVRYQKSYDFRIIFSDKHDSWRKEYYNFAITHSQRTSDNNKIIHIERSLFQPANSPDITSTKIISELLERQANVPPVKDPNDKFLPFERRLEEVKRNWASYTISESQVNFLKDCHKDFFTTTNKSNIAKVTNKANSDVF